MEMLVLSEKAAELLLPGRGSVNPQVCPVGLHPWVCLSLNLSLWWNPLSPVPSQSSGDFPVLVPALSQPLQLPFGSQGSPAAQAGLELGHRLLPG